MEMTCLHVRDLFKKRKKWIQRMTQGPQILNSQQVAEMLGCSPRTVEDYARAGRFPGAKFGDGWVFVLDLIIDTVRQITIEEAAARRAKLDESADPAASVFAVNPTDISRTKSRRRAPANTSVFAHLLHA
jgi:transcriptional regulator with XRE-family HTH domain